MIKTRLILKISGAALKNNSADQILSSEKLKDLTRQIKQIHRKYDIGIVIGGGNI
jgi:uridylate kinase